MIRKLRPLSRPAATAALLLALAAVAALAQGAAAAHSAGNATTGTVAASQPVYVAAESCTGHSYRPRRVILACADANLYVAALHYSSYGTREARASGVFHLNDCTPDCAGGHFHTYSGSIRMFDVVRCSDGRRYFAKARYSFPHRYGKGVALIRPMSCSSRSH